MQSFCSGWGKLFDSLLEWAHPVVKWGTLNFDGLDCRWYFQLNSALCLLPIGINVNLEIFFFFQKGGASCKGVCTDSGFVKDLKNDLDHLFLC